MVTCRCINVLCIWKGQWTDRKIEKARGFSQRKRLGWCCGGFFLKGKVDRKRNRSFSFTCASSWKWEMLAFNRKVRILCSKPVLLSVYLFTQNSYTLKILLVEMCGQASSHRRPRRPKCNILLSSVFYFVAS